MAKLKDFLETNKINPTQLAAMLGVKENSVINWLRGKHDPQVKHLKMLQKIAYEKDLEINVLDLF